MYLPSLRNARPAYRYRIGNYVAVIMTDCESIGAIEYTHVLFLLDPNLPNPIFAVAAEVNTMPFTEGPTRLFLGVFPGSRHENHGLSADWVDLDKFSGRALQIVAERFEIAETPVLLPLPKPGLN
ncbi:MAG: hypothetical protein ABI700_28380 [Chloroflexota bacterium]